MQMLCEQKHKMQKTIDSIFLCLTQTQTQTLHVNKA